MSEEYKKLSPAEQTFAESGLSEDFKDRWIQAYQTYDPDSVKDTFWDKTANFFGSRSTADVTRMQLEQKRKEALNQLVNQGAEQKYNSEAEQIARLRAAGQNPDLQGGVEPSEATEGTEPEQPVDFSGLSTGADVAQGFAKAFTSALSLYSGVQQIQSMSISNEIARFKRFSDEQKPLTDLFFSLLEKDGFEEAVQGMFDDPDKFNVFPSVSPSMLKGLGYTSRKSQKRILAHFDMLSKGLKGSMLKYKNLSDLLTHEKDFVKEYSEWYRGSNPFSDKDVASALKSWLEFLHNVDNKEQELSMASSKSGIKVADYTGKYYGGLDATKAYMNTNQANEYSKYVLQQKQKLYNKLVGEGDTFSLLLAVQLMGDVDLLGNSGIKGAASTAMDFYNPVKKIKKL